MRSSSGGKLDLVFAASSSDAVAPIIKCVLIVEQVRSYIWRSLIVHATQRDLLARS